MGNYILLTYFLPPLCSNTTSPSFSYTTLLDLGYIKHFGETLSLGTFIYVRAHHFSFVVSIVYCYRVVSSTHG